MTKKIFFLILLSFVLLSSCINLTNSPKPSPTPDVIAEAYKINNPDGKITVIYRNEYKMRVDRENHKIISRVDKEAEEVINNILNKYELSYSDLSSDQQTEEEMDKMQSDYQNKTNVDIPHLMSIHYYKFSKDFKDVDVLLLLRDLQNTPYVKEAYSTHLTVITF